MKITKKNIIRVIKKEPDLFFTFPLSLLFLFFLIIIYPFIKIRVGFLRSDRIGHFSLETELYLLEKKNKKIHSIDLFYLGRKKICNYTLEKLWRKKLIILPRFILRPVCIQIRFFNFLNFLRCGQTQCGERDIHNLLDQYPPTIQFEPEDLAYGENQKLKIGLPKKAKFICLIVRDSTYLEKLYEGEKLSKHDYRNADIDNFIDACETLTKMGYYVIRMGAAVAKPIKTSNKMIIDYAYNNLRTDFMDIYLASQCEFCITTGTGLDGVSLMFRRPNIYVNVAPLFYLRTECSSMISIPCHYYSLRQKRCLNISEITHTDMAIFLDSKDFQKAEIELRQNSSEEIKQVCIEAVKRQSNEWDDKEGDILQENFTKTFPSEKLFNSTKYHGKIKGRIGINFLKQNKWWLN